MAYEDYKQQREEETAPERSARLETNERVNSDWQSAYEAAKAAYLAKTANRIRELQESKARLGTVQYALEWFELAALTGEKCDPKSVAYHAAILRRGVR
jgi:hypothetical protein